MAEKARTHIFVSGRVQGVLYRRGAQKKAQELGITGFAHNLADGRVELMAEGDKEGIEQLMKWCKEGTPMAKVDRLDSQFEDYKGEFADFEIREFGF